ncbi:MAG TPA: hypothetical protein VJZ49_13530 [Syntrophales bacterium]|nr:hypothetical protein [Syntrophales bacterium]
MAFIIFNRPDLTRIVFEVIRKAQPLKLLLIADGPRADRPGEAEKCDATRAIVEQVDWPCEVLNNYSDTNLGCKRRVTSGLDWVFSTVPEAIILEDDCLPNPTFFRFCAELLEHYRDDKRIMMISGDNFQDGNQCTPYSYYFSSHVHIWGWAVWRRAWMHYSDNLDRWPALRETNWLRKTFQDKYLSQYWRAIFDRLYQSPIDTWDYYWMYSIWNQNGLSVIPAVNLVSNIGFDQRATHTVNDNKRMANRPTGAITFPLNHPHDIVQNVKADRYTSTHALAIRPLSIWPLRMIRKLRQIFLTRNGT